MNHILIFIISWIAIGWLITISYGLTKTTLKTTIEASIILGFLGPFAILLYTLKD
jgi:hypothetical protein